MLRNPEVSILILLDLIEQNYIKKEAIPDAEKAASAVEEQNRIQN